MRRELRPVVLSDFLDALTIVGYSRLRPEEDPCLEWRRGSFHLFLGTRGKRRRILVLRMHRDVPSGAAPFHRAKRRGKELRTELNLVMEAYRRMRASR